MSISAPLADLGALASARGPLPTRLQPAKPGSEREDAFRDMLRDAERETRGNGAQDPDRAFGRERAAEAQSIDRARAELPDSAIEARERRLDERRLGPERPDRGWERGSAEGPAESRQDNSAADEASIKNSDRAAKDSKAAKPAEEPVASDGQAEPTAPEAATAQSDAHGAAVAETAASPLGALPAAVKADGTLAQIAAPAVTDPAPAQAGAGTPIAATNAQAAPALVAAAAAPIGAAPNGDAAVVAEDSAVEGVELQAASGRPAQPASADGKAVAETGAPGQAAAVDEAEAPGAAPTIAAAKEGGAAKASGDIRTIGEAKSADEIDSLGQPKASGEAKGAGDAKTPGKPDAAQANAPAGPAAQATAQVSAHAAPHSAAREALAEAGSPGQPQGATPSGSGVVQAPAPGSAADLRQPVPAQPAPRPEIPVPLQAVAIEIGMRAMRGAKEFAIRLDPEDLGRIDVKLEVSDAGQVQAKVMVEKVETLQLLQRDARTLERAFDQAGLKTTPDGLQFSLRDPGGQGRNGDQPAARTLIRGRAEEEAPIDEIRLQPAQYRYAAAGGLDIRI